MQVKCSCCGSFSNVADKDLERMSFDAADDTVVMCRKCLAESMREPEIQSNNQEPDIILKFRAIVKNKTAAGIKHGRRSTLVDLFSANSVCAVWDGLSAQNREKWLTVTEGCPRTMVVSAFKLINK